MRFDDNHRDDVIALAGMIFPVLAVILLVWVILKLFAAYPSASQERERAGSFPEVHHERQ